MLRAFNKNFLTQTLIWKLLDLEILKYWQQRILELESNNDASTRCIYGIYVAFALFFFVFYKSRCIQ